MLTDSVKVPWGNVEIELWEQVEIECEIIYI